jgi:hypothetical protein
MDRAATPGLLLPRRTDLRRFPSPRPSAGIPVAPASAAVAPGMPSVP